MTEDVTPEARWVAAYQRAWAGWATFAAIDQDEERQRCDRLRRAGCPFGADPLITLNRVEHAIATTRRARRHAYVGRVSEHL